MITTDTVKKLADLARISVPEEERAGLTKDLEAILGYVSELGKAGASDAVLPKDEVRNIMRNDELFHQPGEFTEQLLGSAPRAENGYVAVRRIIEK